MGLEDEPAFEDAEPDVEDGDEGDDVSGVEPDSLFAGVFSFSVPLPVPSLACFPLSFDWLGSFSLLE